MIRNIISYKMISYKMIRYNIIWKKTLNQLYFISIKIWLKYYFDFIFNLFNQEKYNVIQFNQLMNKFWFIWCIFELFYLNALYKWMYIL